MPGSSRRAGRSLAVVGLVAIAAPAFVWIHGRRARDPVALSGNEGIARETSRAPDQTREPKPEGPRDLVDLLDAASSLDVRLSTLDRIVGADPVSAEARLERATVLGWLAARAQRCREGEVARKRVASGLADVDVVLTSDPHNGRACFVQAVLQAAIGDAGSEWSLTLAARDEATLWGTLASVELARLHHDPVERDLPRLRRLVASNPERLEAWLELARTCEALGQRVEAGEAATRILAHLELDEALGIRARVLWAEGQGAGAEKDLTALLALGPGDADALRLRVRVCFRTGKHAVALEDDDRLAALGVGNPELKPYERIRALLGAGRKKEGVAALEAAIQNAEPEELEDLSCVRADLRADQGQLQEALFDLGTAQRRRSKVPAGPEVEGLGLVEAKLFEAFDERARKTVRDGHPDKAFNDLGSAMWLARTAPVPVARRAAAGLFAADLYSTAGLLDLARGALAMVTSCTEAEVPVLLLRARLSIIAGKVREASADCAALASYLPASDPALAALEAKLERARAALESKLEPLRARLEESPRDTAALLERAVVLLDAGDTEQALTDLKLAALRGPARIRAESLLLQANLPGGSESMIEDAAKADRSFAPAAMALTSVWQARDARQLNPDRRRGGLPAPHDIAASDAYRKGFRGVLDRVVALDPKDARVHIYYALIDSDVDARLAHLDAAVKLDPLARLHPGALPALWLRSSLRGREGAVADMRALAALEPDPEKRAFLDRRAAWLERYK